MTLNNRQESERLYHDAEHNIRDDNGMIVFVYASGLFDEAEAEHIHSLGDVCGQRVLDYGCGTGQTTIQLGRLGAAATGLDISKTRLLVAQSSYGESRCPTPAEFVVGAGETLPFSDGSFDAVLGKQILHHLDLSVAMPEIARVLRPGGRAVFLEPLAHNPLLGLYRRLTPKLRSPTEQALSALDVEFISGFFAECSHTEYCLLAVLPVLIARLLHRSSVSKRWLHTCQRLDRALLKVCPGVGRYYWEAVLVLEK